jgi:hypothetical protein
MGIQDARADGAALAEVARVAVKAGAGRQVFAAHLAARLAAVVDDDQHVGVVERLGQVFGRLVRPRYG